MMNSLSYQPAPEAPGGPALIRWLAAAAGVRDRVLTDGVHTVSYAEAAGLLDRVDDLFARHGMTRRHPVALECSQSVAGALAILHLLSREYDVVLLPELGESSKESGTPRFIPSFCSHVVTASARPSRPEADSPENGLGITVNEAFAEEPAIAGFEGPDLYLRTSGSTASAKLTRLSHQTWLNNAL